MEQKQSFLCRLCLKVGATHPIFDGDEETERSLMNKLSMCLNEKIEDIDGFPRYICDECNETLDTLCIFIKKIKNTNTILQSGLCLQEIKQQAEYFNNLSEEEDLRIEYKLEDVHYDADTDHNSDFSDKDISEKLVDVHYDADTDHNSDFSDKDISEKLEDVHYVADTDHNLDFSDKDISEKPLQPTNTRKRILKSKSLTINNNVAQKRNNTAISKVTRSSCSKRNKNTDKPVGENTNGCRKTLLVELHKDKALSPKLCHICGEVFKRSKELSSHKQKKHNKKAECPQCKKTFVSSYCLMKHIRRVHGGQKDFVCSKCSKAFAFKNDLSNHMLRVHNKKVVEKKTFSCKICNKIYNCERSVIIHERSVHTGERPAVCSVCGNSFFHDQYLRQHMILHTGKTQYKCPICGRGYAQQGNMKSHLRIHKRSELDNDTLNKIRPSYLKLLKP